MKTYQRRRKLLQTPQTLLPLSIFLSEGYTQYLIEKRSLENHVKVIKEGVLPLDEGLQEGKKLRRRQPLETLVGKYFNYWKGSETFGKSHTGETRLDLTHELCTFP